MSDRETETQLPRPFIHPLSTLQEVQQEYDDTVRLIDQACSRPVVSVERRAEFLGRQEWWLERLGDQLVRMRAGEVA